MDNPADDDRATRIRQARQVLAGNEITVPDDPLGFGDRFVFGGSGDLAYFLALAGVTVVAAIVFAIWGLGAASPILFLLALGLILGWFIL